MALAARIANLRPAGGLLAGWRGLGRFWAVVLGFLALVAVLLQLLGPSAQFLAMVQPGVHGSGGAHEAPDAKAHVVAKPASVSGRPGRAKLGPVAGPDPALLEPYFGHPDLKLPRVAADGRTAMSVYASGFDQATRRPRVGLLVAGIGMSEAESLAAIKTLPAAVTLAVSPYAGDVTRLLDAARTGGHEYLLSVPMEPQGYPVNDPDDRYALMTALPPSENLDRLRGIMARLTGYVGVTNALGQMHGERLSGVPDQLEAVLEEVGHRGLLFVDARAGQPVAVFAWNRCVDLVLDEEPIDSPTLARRLDTLSQIALDKGVALGMVSVPRPLTLERVAAWTNTLSVKGLALAPVSALALPPPKEETGK